MKLKLETSALPRTAPPLFVVLATDSASVSASGKHTSSAPIAAPELLSTDQAIRAAASAVLASGEFRASAQETLLLHAPAGLAAERLLIIGLGKRAKVTLNDIRKAAGTAVRFAKARSIRELAIALPEHDNWSAEDIAQAAAEGALIGDFDSDTYKSDREDKSVHAVTLIAPEGAKDLEAAVNRGVVLGESVNYARAMINEPGNKLTPTIFGQRVKAMADEVGLDCNIYSTEKMQELKMGAFLSVALGSPSEPPALMVMTYEPETALAPDSPVVGLIGKGITFDTGGISIKPADGMEKMKYDMAGGAAMAGAMRAIALLKPNVKVIGIICSTENMPSGTAQKPGDIQTAMSGKTIEIMNTDAEGRLVLADGITYAKQLGATHLIDAATLTGAVAVALGTINAGMFTNDEPTLEKFKQGLNVTGERFWELPAEDDYREHIKSSIADIMNTGDTRYGGAITAAMFLKEFAEDTPWIHLDIAGVAWIDTAKPWMAKGPSGIAVRSIYEWVNSYST